MAAGPASPILVSSRASSVRGQGHWPWMLRLASSMATITAGADAVRRGASS
jgi:hypothetical protein